MTTLGKIGILTVHKKSAYIDKINCFLAWKSISIDGDRIKKGHNNFLYRDLNNQKIKHDSIVLYCIMQDDCTVINNSITRIFTNRLILTLLTSCSQRRDRPWNLKVCYASSWNYLRKRANLNLDSRSSARNIVVVKRFFVVH